MADAPLVMVVLETRDGALNPASDDLVASAARMSSRVIGVVPGHDIAGVAAAAAALGFAEVVALESPALEVYTADGYVSALSGLITDTEPACVVLSHTYQARDYAPALAARLQAPFLPDCTAVTIDAGRWCFTRPMFRGKVLADVVVDGDGPFVVSFQAGARPADDVRPAAVAPVRQVAAVLDAAAIRQIPEPPFRQTVPTVDLAHADRIVAVGRGIKTEDQIPLIRRLADAMHAELAASRPICDAGWLPMDRQIGSSGQTVRPKLYVAVGISGAIQHIVGMRGSRTIVAINRDADAPIFEIADYGIVGDLFEVVPALIAALDA